MGKGKDQLTKLTELTVAALELTELTRRQTKGLTRARPFSDLRAVVSGLVSRHGPRDPRDGLRIDCHQGTPLWGIAACHTPAYTPSDFFVKSFGLP